MIDVQDQIWDQKHEPALDTSRLCGPFPAWLQIYNQIWMELDQQVRLQIRDEIWIQHA